MGGILKMRYFSFLTFPEIIFWMNWDFIYILDHALTTKRYYFFSNTGFILKNYSEIFTADIIVVCWTAQIWK